MDARIQKYARWLEIAAWLMFIVKCDQWITKWFGDFIIRGLAYLCYSIGIASYSSLAEAFEKLPSDSDKLLYTIKLADASISAEIAEPLVRLANLSWAARLLGFFFDGIVIVILAVGFWYFIKLMKQLKQGSIFSIEVIESLNKLAKIIFWFAIYLPINRSLIALVVTFNNTPGQRLFMTSITLGDCFVFCASWFFLILTALMKESHELKKDQDLTV